jgi:hypothetical protein
MNIQTNRCPIKHRHFLSGIDLNHDVPKDEDQRGGLG